MNLDEFKHIWESEKDNWVLVNTQYGYSIINKKEQTALLVSDEDLEKRVIQQMLDAGNRIYADIKDAYADV